MARRVEEIKTVGQKLLELGEPLGIPDRSYDALVDAALGYRVQRPSYAKQTGVEDRTATRDLKQLADAGLLEAHGQTRGRSYVAGEPIRRLRQETRAARPVLVDPYPDLMTKVRSSLSQVVADEGLTAPEVRSPSSAGRQYQ